MHRINSLNKSLVQMEPCRFTPAVLEELQEAVEIHAHHYVNMRLYQSYFILACALYTSEASLRAAAVGTTPSSPLQRRAKQSHGRLGFELYAYAGGSGGVLNI